MIQGACHQRGLHRSRSSLHSLSSLDVPTPVSSPRGLSRSSSIRKSTSSLSLKNLGLSSDAIKSQQSLCSKSLDEGNNEESTKLDLSNDPQIIMQWVLIFALGLQMPRFQSAVLEIIDLHIHGFPLLVIFASAFPPSSGCHQVQRHPVDTDIVKESSSIVEKNITPVLSPPPKLRPATTSPPFDEWGHFADFSDIQEREVAFHHPSYARAMSLASLQETEIEEDF